MIKLIHVVDMEALNNAKQTQALIQGDKGVKLIWVMRDNEGVIRQVINTSTKQPYTKVQPYINNASALNLTEKETKDAIEKGLITVYRSSGATNEKGETLTREEQVARGVARAIEVRAEQVKGAKGSTSVMDYSFSVFSDTGASVKLEGEFEL